MTATTDQRKDIDPMNLHLTAQTYATAGAALEAVNAQLFPALDEHLQQQGASLHIRVEPEGDGYAVKSVQVHCPAVIATTHELLS
jgi:hypothetical protein